LANPERQEVFMTQFCAMCGANSKDSQLMAGKQGYVCFGCIGGALNAVSKTYGQPREVDTVKHVPDATQRCFVCDLPVTSATLIAYRHPFCFCGVCLADALDVAVSQKAPMLQVANF
jgi:hypothetical protein